MRILAKGLNQQGLNRDDIDKRFVLIDETYGITLSFRCHCVSFPIVKLEEPFCWFFLLGW